MLVVGLYCPNMAGLHCLGIELHCSESVELHCPHIAEPHCSDNVEPHWAVGAHDYTGAKDGDAPSRYDSHHALDHLLPDFQVSGYLPYCANFHSLLTHFYSSQQ